MVAGLVVPDGGEVLEVRGLARPVVPGEPPGPAGPGIVVDLEVM